MAKSVLDVRVVRIVAKVVLDQQGIFELDTAFLNGLDLFLVKLERHCLQRCILVVVLVLVKLFVEVGDVVWDDILGSLTFFGGTLSRRARFPELQIDTVKEGQ